MLCCLYHDNRVRLRAEIVEAIPAKGGASLTARHRARNSQSAQGFSPRAIRCKISDWNAGGP
jgi:hypothetical protein